MNSIVHKNHLTPKIGWEVYGTVLAMLLFTLLEFGLKGVELPVLMVFGMSSVNYFLILVLYVGIAMLAYKGHTWLLWGSGIMVYILGYMFTGIDFAWTMFSEWSMILVGGAIIGRLVLKNEAPQKVYTIGMVTVLLFAMAMYLPLLPLITDAISKSSVEMLKTAEATLPTVGYTAEETASHISGMKLTLLFVERIIPSLLMLSSVLQYSIGYLVFMYLLSRKKNTLFEVAPFTMWKMPFYMTSILLVGAGFHFFGDDGVSRIGDNILFFLAFFYSISGISLMEYYLKKLKFPRFVKISFYVLLFLAQHFGFIVAIFIGFIDSFKDFRNKEMLNLQNE